MEQLTYTNSMKKFIGILCCYEILKMEGTILPNNDEYFRDSMGVPICSKRTMYRIAIGNVSPNEDIYDRLLEFTNSNFTFDMELNLLINTFSWRLFDAVDEYKFESIESICTQLLHLLSLHHKTLYYGHLLLLIQDIKRCYVDGEYLNSDDYNKYFTIITCFNKSIQILVKNLLFQYAAFVAGDKILMKSIVEKFQFAESDTDILRMKYALYLKYQLQLIEAYNIFDELQRKYAKSRNYCRYIDICNLKSNISNGINPNEVIKLEIEIEKTIYLHSDSMSKIFLSNIYYVIGARRFSNKQNQEAIKYFQLSWDYGNIRRGKEIQIYLIFLRQCENVAEALLSFEDNLHCSNHNIVDICYTYFVKKKQGQSAKELEDYITYEILPKFSSYDSFFFLVFESEMIELNSLTRRHKKLSHYRKTVAKIERKLL